MSFLSILYSLLIQPIQILFETIYGIAYLLFENHIAAIFMLSITMNLLVLPLYSRADAMQEEERLIEAKLADGVAHIKKTFRGDERMMMLQTYYRQNNYKPIYALRSATSLLLQIPFFVAAYRFLSTYELLSGVSFGVISDLSKPDQIINAFGLNINILPILMTVINIISSFIYSKGLKAKDKAQLFLTAFVFLVLLYKSPSGLVLYWTLNNCFSLLKNVVNKTKDKKKTTALTVSVIGMVWLLLEAFTNNLLFDDEHLIYCLIPFLCQYPLLFYIIIKRFNKKDVKRKENVPKLLNGYANSPKLFFSGAVLLAVLTGLVIPSNVIKSSPQEFAFPNYSFNPLWYIVSALCISIGTFVIWLGVFYWLSSHKGKTVFEIFVSIACVCSLINYWGFDHYLGTLKKTLYYFGLTYPASAYYIDLILVIIFAGLMSFLVLKFQKKTAGVILVAVIAFCGLGIINSVNIGSYVTKDAISSSENENFSIKLSKDEKNVVVFMMDRAMGCLVPYLFNERPELREQFRGFEYYSNVISYGRSTNFGVSPVFGGYEYTPIEMNTRSTESLKDKHNEALCLMPIVFGENNYDVTFVNPTYANYSYIPDLSIFDKYPYISSFNIEDLSEDDTIKEVLIKDNERNFFVFSIMKISPIFMQQLIYDNGRYYKNNSFQEVISPHEAIGNEMEFVEESSVIENLSKYTTVTEGKSQLFMLSNCMTHDIQLLQEPEYNVAPRVDNTAYDNANMSRFTVNNRTLNMKNSVNYSHYQSNMRAILLLGKWLDHLKEIGVYDNTRIIIVSDHGYALNMGTLIDDLFIENYNYGIGDANSYYPLLMVKDFNSSNSFSTSDEFMTNADVPTIAFEGIIDNPVNPFTGKVIDSSEKTAHNQYILGAWDFDVAKNTGNQFCSGRWYSVHDSIWEHKNWKRVADNDVLTKDDITE